MRLDIAFCVRALCVHEGYEARDVVPLHHNTKLLPSDLREEDGM